MNNSNGLSILEEIQVLNNKLWPLHCTNCRRMSEHIVLRQTSSSTCKKCRLRKKLLPQEPPSWPLSLQPSSLPSFFNTLSWDTRDSDSWHQDDRFFWQMTRPFNRDRQRTSLHLLLLGKGPCHSFHSLKMMVLGVVCSNKENDHQEAQCVVGKKNSITH